MAKAHGELPNRQRLPLDWWRRGLCDKGETLVEFAIASTLFLTILFGTIQFGLAVWRYNIISDLAQEGARWAAVRGSTAGAVQHATATDVRSFVQSRSVGLTVTVNTTPDPGSIAPPQIVTVQVQTTFSAFTPLLSVGTLTLESTSQMVMQR